MPNRVRITQSGLNANHGVGIGASEDPPGDIGRLLARRGAEAKPALFQGCDSWKGSQDMQFTTTKKIAAALGAGAVAVAGSGVAFAFWTTTGEGATSASVAGASNGTVTLAGSVPAGITPGGSETVTFTAANPGSTDLRVGTITLKSVSITKATAHSSEPCSASDFTMTDVAANQTVPHGTAATSPVTLTATGTLTFANDLVNSQDGCKGASVVLNLTSN